MPCQSNRPSNRFSARRTCTALLVLTVLLVTPPHLPAVDLPTEAEQEFTFVVLGDSQFHLPNKFNQVIDEVVHLYPAFVVQVGDMISGYVDSDELFRQQWRLYRFVLASA